MSLKDKVCVVTGATRGIGRGIALQLGAQGATVYVTGRTLKAKDDAQFPGSLEQTCEEIESRGGKCIPVQCDHKIDDDVKKLFEKVAREQNNRLDVLVNNAFSAFSACVDNVKVPFWELPDNIYDELNQVGLRNHYLCSVLAARLMVPRKSGLIINISGHGGMTYTLNVPYGIGKEGCDRMAVDCARELREHNVAFVCLWPCVVKTEGSQAIFKDPKLSATMAVEAGVSEQILRDNYKYGESVEYVGMCVVQLANDTNIMKMSGKVHITSDLGDHYGFRDDDGHKPINIRRINCLLKFAPSWISWVSNFVPDFVKIPSWLMSFAGHKLN
ncbi:dehydrogenase/reductase SDR family member 1-like [Mya arenaria]|uniref:dehydrogenase/reductase SDR family member 1-like n=1 Tax=Mya arenaria TaxID=6604 RepID=UPI0022E13F1F|nr:dehydrogenase/reductase SDR family member 1-like [Mya arenaria]XP_052774921.1 dehydrogenase/reductase SDR family member 1-like [Mya arenaria]XP_052774922.1 dehydrogenase/reductase SDR family member 1-like [Mya arenaria]XP_052774923.1 dehydrogenase/reductase SDR family member 1-like [Mya arenaria]XP_052776493.1 dehydrogenase/reductase SDR family member 1-like [Mya arenaria]XP_052776494.1 dehydrogenase/reductase SDR family member 1-like [Mya arenaria]XP_052776495.1 dehydrogenase/reductase SD